MAASKLTLLLLAAALLPLCAQARAEDALDRGGRLFLLGNSAGALNYFSAAAAKNPLDQRAKDLFSNCLVIKAKEELAAGNYTAGRADLEKARGLFPDRRDLKLLGLLAELEQNAPAGNVALSSASLDASAEKGAVLECIFGGSKCAGEKHFVHVVVEGETMSTIAIKYFNTMAAWEKIWAANPGVSNPHRLEKGTRLIIPLPK